jgi:hypothetical protein
MMADYRLTPKQKAAFEQLDKAIKRCMEADVYMWIDYTALCAVNGSVVSFVAPDSTIGDPLDRDQLEMVDGVFFDANADDGLYVKLN